MYAAHSPSLFEQSDSVSETGAGQEQADSDSETEAKSDSDEQHGQDQYVYESEEDEVTDGVPSEDEVPSEDGLPDAQRRKITDTDTPKFRDLQWNFEELGKSAALWINGLLYRRDLHVD